MCKDKLDRVLTWTTDDVSDWLTENDLSQYVELLCGKHKIDGKSLLTLTESDLREPPLNLEIVGDIKRLMIGIWKLQKLNSESCYILLPGDISSSSDQSSCSNGFAFHEFQNGGVINADRSESLLRSLNPELWKTALSFLYAFFVYILMGYIVMISNERMPTGPPLPDVILDNLPRLWWAMEVMEVLTLILGLTACCIIFFHRHRLIVMRRAFLLSGTIYLLRSVTVLITSLPASGRHIHCDGHSYSTLGKIKQSFAIFQKFGLNITGVQNCGDYIFSGHTVVLTLLNFFIVEYCPRFVLIPILSWTMNILGMFFILAAHDHYSIDIFIAFYIASRLFLYYHTLANNRYLMQHDRSRMRFWFPLFSFFESNTEGVVPNEYEWPLPWPKSFKRCFNNKRTLTNNDYRPLLSVCTE